MSIRSLPLASVLRPKSLDDVIGQNHLLGPGGPLRSMVEKKKFKSSIIWGPPGIGKTSLVRAMALESDSIFRQLNATSASVKELRSVVDSAAGDNSRFTLVFVDEIHRWSKSQQDVMLPAVEDGIIVLFGATTEKPQFAVNSTLLSRCLVFELKPLDEEAMVRLFLKVKNHYKGCGLELQVTKSVAKCLISRCSGDARKLVTAFEAIVEVVCEGGVVTQTAVDAIIPTKYMVFDASGNEHFDLAHCYQESIQNSDVDSAIFWLAKWIASGEDPAYICRRMLITAFEDCASNPHAATTAMAAHYTTERTGLPECMIPMALATCEMAKSPRNKAAYHAIKAAMADVENGMTIHVPEGLRAGAAGYVHAISKQYVHGWEDE